jgi:hypothetical protein
MDRRVKLASGATIVATVVSGALAAAALTGMLGAADSSIGRLSPLGATETAATGIGAPPAGTVTPGGAAGPPGSGAGRDAGGTAPAVPTSAAVPTAGAALAPAPAAAPSPAPAAAPPPASTGPPPSAPSPPTTVAPTPAPSGWDCHGSDDGLTEAEKKAREAACHGLEDDD